MATSIGSTNLTTTNTWQLLEAINPDPSQSSTMAVYTNGNLVTSGVSQSGTTTVTAPLYINGRNGTSTNSYASYLAEMVVFNTGLTLSNRQMIEGYLAWKWGLQASLPNTHPYYSATPSAGTTAVGNLTVDTTGNIQVAPTNTFRVLGPTEWRTNMITVSGTSLTIPTPTTGAPTTYSAALYTLTNTGFNALTLPTYTAGSPGVFWELYNSTASNLTIAVTYTSGSGLGSSFTLNAGSSTNIYWSGSAFQAISGQGPTGPGFTTITTPGTNFVLTTASSTSSNAAVANSNLTFNGSTLAVTGNITTTSTTSNSIGGVILSNSVISSPAATNLQITTPAGYNLTINPSNQLIMTGNVVSLSSGQNITFTIPSTCNWFYQNGSGVVTTISGLGNFSNSNATSNNIGGSTLSNTIITVGAATTGYTTAGSVNVLSNYFVNGTVQPATYTLPETSSTAQYIFLGTWNTSQGGKKLLINVISGNGYNNLAGQQQNTELFINTGNGSSSQNGTSGGLIYFSAAAYVNSSLGATTASPSTFRIVQVSSVYSTSQFTVYGNFGGFTGYGSMYTVTIPYGDSWQNSSTLYGVTGPTGTYLDVTPTAPSSGGGGTISGTYTSGTVLLATGTTTGLQGSANMSFSGTLLDVNGGVTIRNGFRPSYSLVSSGTSITVAPNSYGYHYNITTSGITGITLPTGIASTDSNAYWVFRNNTSGYLSITFTYQTAGTTPTNPVVIPPSNAITMMVTYPSSSLVYVLF